MSSFKLTSAKKSVLAVGMLVLTGCVNIDVDIEFTPDAAISNRIVAQDVDQFADISPLYINDEIKSYLDKVFNHDANQPEQVERLQEILFDEKHLGIQYSDQATQTAVELFESRAGNCLSVMNLYIAMARHVGIDAAFQTVQVRPSWDRRGTLFVISQHINATGKINQRNTYVVDFTPDISLQQLTANVITDTQARALFFTNLGVEQMLIGDFESALGFLQNALWIDPELSIAWNNIGTAYNRIGDLELAEYSYQMAFEVDQTNATAINNLARYYEAQGDDERAGTYRRAISRFNRKNPYYHFNLGNVAYQSGDLEEAVTHFRRAIRIKDLEPDFYLALAQVYEQTGNRRMQRQMLSEASDTLVENLEIYQPSDQKVRFIDNQTILRNTSPGLKLITN